MNPNSLLTNLTNQAKATFQFVINENKSPESRLKYIELALLEAYLQGMETVMKIHEEYSPSKAHSPMYDAVNATYMELKEMRKNL